jgi:hypothetical protein
MKITPRLLDWAINGVPVYIRRRPADGYAYATVMDFTGFVSDGPIETIRMKVTADTPTDYNFETDPYIVAKVKAYNNEPGFEHLDKKEHQR